MNKNLRRNLLKGVAVSAPAVWAKPVVNSVLLPVHASTSCGCEEFGSGPNSRRFVAGSFPTGELLVYNGVTNCSGDPTMTHNVVEASDADEAVTRWFDAYGETCDSGEMENWGYQCASLWDRGEEPCDA